MDYLWDERVSPKVEGLVLGSLVTSSPSGRFSVYIKPSLHVFQ